MRNSGIAKLLLTTAALVLAGTGAIANEFNWEEEGPGPILNGANTALPNNSPVAGAINAIVPSRTSPDVVFVGTVSGGVWKTSNATAAVPAWIPLTDHQLPQLPIKSLAMSPVKPQTLFAGTGSTTSFNRFGELGIGVARSTDGGETWKVLARSTFTGRTITSIVPTTLNGGKTVLAATWPDQGGVYRSTDNGVAFTRISGNGTSGLPNAGVTNLIADPSNANRFYAAVPGLAGGGAAAGVYRSDNGGLTWTAVNTGLSGLATSLRILLTIHNSGVDNVVYADVIAADGTLSGVFRSTNQGASWTSLGVPLPPIYPGAQGFFHGAFAADPSNPNVVFISGDRQGTLSHNLNGCTSFSANVFRYTGTEWENVVCLGANGTSPHPDSRFMAFDAGGNLLQTNDGGIARLVNPNTPTTRKWASVVGNIRSAELHSIAYDSLSNIVFGGTQDNGTPIQSSPGAITWNEFFGGDGGVVGVDANQVTHPGTSLRYSSAQFFGGFSRSTWDASNTFLGNVLVGLHITAGAGTGQTLFQFDPNIEFYQPYTLNAIDPARMLIGTANIYESLNGGESLNNLGFTGAFVGGNQGYGRAIVYGSRLSGSAKPDGFYVGAGAKIFHRVTAGGPITTLGSYPGGVVITITMNPNNYKQVYVSDLNNKVWGSSDEGATWVDLSANLPALTGLVTTIEVFSPDATVGHTTLIAGGFGVFHLRNPSSPSGHWTRLTGGGDGDDRISNALVLDLHVDYTRNVLAASTLGRGAWLFGDEDVIGEIASRALPSASSIAAASSTAAKPILPPAPPPSLNYARQAGGCCVNS